MRVKFGFVAVVASVCIAGVAAATHTATAQGSPHSTAAGPAFGFVPSHNVNSQKPHARLSLLSWHGGPVMHSTTVAPVFWGAKWNTLSFPADKVSGLDYLYSNIGGTPYAHTNFEFTDGATSFVKSWHSLLAVIASKSAALAAAT